MMNNNIRKNSRASIDFSIEWTSSVATHQDIYHAQAIDLEKDVFPEGLAEIIAELSVGESYTADFSAEELLKEGYSTNNVKTFDAKLFNRNFKQQNTRPELYRFYPKTIAWQALGSFAGDFTPFRLISINEDNMTADCNHPLSKYYLTLTVTKTKEFENEPNNEGKNVGTNVGELITQKGPGMQAPFEFGDTVFFDDYPFKRSDENDDAQFYYRPRTIHHLDATATSEVTKLYAELLTPDTEILDLMSSWVSHLPEHMHFKKVVGLGLNELELKANEKLDKYDIYDLNKDYTLPYGDNSFDHAVCTVSIEYLTHPLEIMHEIARVVRPGGKFIVTFSERWFPPKAINLWSQLHPFERLQLVLEYFRQTDKFVDLHTYSKRGLPRPRTTNILRKSKLPIRFMRFGGQ